MFDADEARGPTHRECPDYGVGMPEQAIRLSAKAIVVADDAILLTRNRHPDDTAGDFYLLPGGGQLHKESLAACVRREVREETGFSVVVGDVLWIRDYIGANHEFAAHDGDVHQVEVMFSCSVDASVPAVEVTEPDEWQIAVEWVPLDQLSQVRLFPAGLVPHLTAYAASGNEGPSYLGDVN